MKKKNLIVSSFEQLSKEIREDAERILEGKSPLFLSYNEEEITLGVTVVMLKDNQIHIPNFEILKLLEDILWGNLVEDFDPHGIIFNHNSYFDHDNDYFVLSYKLELI
jgi:hypothetical protein